jgi:hypothetical protein
METSVGGVINKFKVKKRRNVLFFEEILAKYVKECEDAGHEEKIFEIGKKWSELTTFSLLPDLLKKVPITVFLNNLAKKIWINLGLVDDLHCEKSGDRIIIETKNEYVTRIIGENEFAVGLFAGSLSAFTNKEIKCTPISQTLNSSSYKCVIGKRVWNPPKSKTKREYEKMNYFPPTKGFTLKDALKKNIIYLDKNIPCFRGKSIIPIESTFFHLVANQGLEMEKVPQICYNFFNEIIDKNTSKEKRLELLKNLLRMMGWGHVSFLFGKNITLMIKKPPYGLQLEKDNWDFIVNVILGFLWTLDRKLKIETKEFSSNIRVIYSN